MTVQEPRPRRSGVPERIGAYQVLGYLGEGGMGRVYQGAAPDGRLVAIKVVRPEYASEPDFRRRFQSEVRNAGRVPRHWTAEVLEASLDGELLYMVTEFIHGRTLHAAVASDGPWSGARLEQLGIITAAALGAIHRAGVIHRDLKPSNVMLSEAGPRVIDFGIARALDTASTVLTATGSVTGTSGFIAPEVYRGQQVTPAADVFAWGGVVVFAGTGRTPFGSGAWQAVAHRVLAEEPDLSGLDTSVVEVVRDALAKEPAARPSTEELQARFAGGTAPRRRGGPAEEQPPAHAPLAPPTARPWHPPPPSAAPAAPPPAGHPPAPPAWPKQRTTRPSPGPPTRSRGRLLLGGAAALLLVVVAAVVASFRGDGPFRRASEEEFSVGIGVEVAQDQPEPGAGELTARARRDTYVFDGTRNSMLLLSDIGCDISGGGPTLEWRLRDPSGADAGSGDFCGTGVWDSPVLLSRALPADGTYRLTVESAAEPRSTYGFRLTEPVAVPIDTAPVMLTDSATGDVASLEVPEDFHVYQFTLEEQTLLFLDARACGNAFTGELELDGPDGPVELRAPQFCDAGTAVDQGFLDLPPGRYSLTARATASYGGYELLIGKVGDQTFQIVPGRPVEPDRPPGAGRIETPGHRDWYQFDAEQGTRISFAVSDCQTGGGAFTTDLRGPNGTGSDDVLTQSGPCGDGGDTALDFVLPAAGTYELSVGAGGTDATGTYRATLTMG